MVFNMIEYKRKLKKFDNLNDYETQKDEVMGIPHVVLLEDTQEIIIEDEIDYTSQPFTLVALENGTISIAMPDGITSMHYALNDNDWIEMTEAVSLTMNANDKVKIKAIGTSFNNNTCSSVFSSSMPFNAEGNIMSLLYGNDFQDKTSLKNMDNECFYSLFSETNIVSAKNLILLATTLQSDCYSSMFYGCTNLTEAPQLPATTLASYCYRNMFNGCTSLTTALELPATILANYCYYSMFQRCSSLNKITMLATDISATNCLSSWVYGVASSGTFIKDATMTSLPSGNNGIPKGWTIQDY